MMGSIIIGRDNQNDYHYLNLDAPNSKLTRQCWAGWPTLVQDPRRL